MRRSCQRHGIDATNRNGHAHQGYHVSAAGLLPNAVSATDATLEFAQLPASRS
jgi:hypothetical protein